MMANINQGPWRTVLCGFGSVAEGIGKDSRMAKYIKYQTHAQVLAQHPAFDWQAVIEPDALLRERALRHWQIPIVVASARELPENFSPEVAVFATKPGPRLALLEVLSPLKGVVTEKPLGVDLAEAQAFARALEQSTAKCQVNLFRRTDRTYRELLDRPLFDLIGEPQAATIIYGNGILNNGLHMIDLARLLLGEIVGVRALGPSCRSASSTIPGDQDVACCLTLANGAVVAMHPIDFHHYRDVLLDVWGTAGRLEIFQEGLFLRHSVRNEHRAIEDAFEVTIDRPIELPSYCGNAYYQLYDDLADALATNANPTSSVANALVSEAVVDAILRSAEQDGSEIRMDPRVRP